MSEAYRQNSERLSLAEVNPQKEQQRQLQQECKTLQDILRSLDKGRRHTYDAIFVTPSIVKEIKEKEQAYIVLKSILEAARKETHYFDGMIEVGLYTHIIDADLGNENIDVVDIRWAPRQERVKVQGKGHYLPPHSGQKGMIEVFSDTPPHFADIIDSLRGMGDFPDSLFTVYHELIHSYQIVEGYESSPELFEMQASRTANCRVSGINTAESVQKGVSRNRACKNLPQGTERIRYAQEVIDTLLSLRLGIREIAELIYNVGHWDPVGGNYPILEERIQAELEKRKIYKENLPLIKEKYELQENIDRLKVMIITEEEIWNWKERQYKSKVAEKKV